MKAKRLCVIGLGLAAFALLFVLARSLPSREPLYQGKPVSVWFKEYAFASNAPAPAVRGYSATSGKLIVQTPSGIQTRPMPVFTNRAEQLLWLQRQTMWVPPPPDPAWIALQALGSNAVPHLVSRLHIGRMDRIYERAFTNLPSAFQRRLPSPAEKRWYRTRALQTIARLGYSARAASPVLLELLKQPDPSLRRDVISALKGVHTDRHAITAVLLQLGSQQRYADVTEIAWQTGWEGDDMARLLGRILQATDPALRRNAMWLLEHSGTGAAPALNEIIRALGDSDPEVRYLAARAVEANRSHTPQIANALRTSLEDDNGMVRNVARRTLTNFPADAFATNRMPAAAKN